MQLLLLRWGRGTGVEWAFRTYRFVFTRATVPHLHLYAHPLCPKDITFFHFKHFCEFNEIFNFYARPMGGDGWGVGGVAAPPFAWTNKPQRYAAFALHSRRVQWVTLHKDK